MLRIIQHLVVWTGLVVLASPAFGSGDYFDVEEFVTALNSPAMRQELGVQEVRRPEDVVNRLEVVFQEGVSFEQRQRVLKDIGQTFLRLLFEETQISTVTVREQTAHGETLDQVMVSLGSPLQSPASTPMSSSVPMGQHD